jgi:hypothetical protein
MVIFEDFRSGATVEEEDPNGGQLPLKEEPTAHISPNNAFISVVTYSFVAIPLLPLQGPQPKRQPTLNYHVHEEILPIQISKITTQNTERPRSLSEMLTGSLYK